MTIYKWPAVKVWLIIADSRFDREQILDNHFDGPVIYVKEFMDSFVDAIAEGERLAKWREPYLTPGLLAITEVQVIEGKQATTETLCEILWERYRQDKVTVLTANFLPDFLEKTFGLPEIYSRESAE